MNGVGGLVNKEVDLEKNVTQLFFFFFFYASYY